MMFASKKLHWYFTLDVFFIAAKMTAQVVMTHDYPKVAPVFVVSVLWQHERTAANDKHVKVRTGRKEKLFKKYNIINLENYYK